jgi:hypothetical protein
MMNRDKVEKMKDTIVEIVLGLLLLVFGASVIIAIVKSLSNSLWRSICQYLILSVN